MKYRCSIAYDGTRFSGWQIQPNSITIQGELEKGIEQLLGKKIAVIGAGRTDAGVHALAQSAHFTCAEDLNTKSFLESINALLPSDIRLLEIEEIDSSFHARYSAKEKIYRYCAHLGPYLPPFKSRYFAHYRFPLDFSLLKEGAKKFLGKRDFKGFANDSDRGSASIDAVRTLYSLDVEQNDDELFFEFRGDGFLYKMVRNIVGTLIEIASQKIPLKKIEEIFSLKDRSLAGKAADPKGLFLVKILY